MTFRYKYFDPAEHDYREVFLAHAKVYALAHDKEVPALETLSIQRLLMTLLSTQDVQSQYRVVTNLEELLKYAYSRPTAEPLRKVVLQFWSLNFPAFAGNGTTALAGSGGDLAKEMMEIVLKWLEVNRGQLKSAISQSESLSERMVGLTLELKSAPQAKTES
jgi:hypothetical protein